MTNQLALDYILRFSKVHRKDRSAELEKRRNFLTVQLKNAVLQIWLQIKEKNKKPDFNEILKKIIKMKKAEAKKNKGKKKKSKLIKEEEAKELSPRSQRYKEVYQSVFDINMKILDAGNNIDSIEQKVLDLQKMQA